jgi:hypothetical protein
MYRLYIANENYSCGRCVRHERDIDAVGTVRADYRA